MKNFLLKGVFPGARDCFSTEYTPGHQGAEVLLYFHSDMTGSLTGTGQVRCLVSPCIPWNKNIFKLILDIPPHSKSWCE